MALLPVIGTGGEPFLTGSPAKPAIAEDPCDCGCCSRCLAGECVAQLIVEDAYCVVFSNGLTANVVGGTPIDGDCGWVGHSGGIDGVDVNMSVTCVADEEGCCISVRVIVTGYGPFGGPTTRHYRSEAVTPWCTDDNDIEDLAEIIPLVLEYSGTDILDPLVDDDLRFVTIQDSCSCAYQVEVLPYNTELCFDWDYDVIIPEECNCEVEVVSETETSICISVQCDDEPLDARLICFPPPECDWDCCDCVDASTGVRLTFDGFEDCEHNDGVGNTYDYFLEQLNIPWNLTGSGAACVGDYEIELGTQSDVADRGLHVLTMTGPTWGTWGHEVYLYKITAHVTCGGDDETPTISITFSFQRFLLTAPTTYVYIMSADLIVSGVGDSEFEFCSGRDSFDHEIESTDWNVTLVGDDPTDCFPITISVRWGAKYPAP